MNIIVVEDEVHSVSVAVDAGNAAVKSGDQVIHRQAVLTGLQKGFGPLVVDLRGDALSAAYLGDGQLAPEPLENYADLLLGGGSPS